MTVLDKKAMKASVHRVRRILEHLREENNGEVALMLTDVLLMSNILIDRAGKTQGEKRIMVDKFSETLNKIIEKPEGEHG